MHIYIHIYTYLYIHVYIGGAAGRSEAWRRRGREWEDARRIGRGLRADLGGGLHHRRGAGGVRLREVWQLLLRGAVPAQPVSRSPAVLESGPEYARASAPPA